MVGNASSWSHRHGVRLSVVNLRSLEPVFLELLPCVCEFEGEKDGKGSGPAAQPPALTAGMLCIAVDRRPKRRHPTRPAAGTHVGQVQSVANDRFEVG